MVFSSISFLFFFLPLLLVIYYLSPRKYRNGILLLFSLFFYFMGEKWYVILLMFSILGNYLDALLIEKWQNKKRMILVLGLIFNIGLLFYFKYTNFFLETFTNLFKLKSITLNVVLPLGISFFTFQNISYLVDVYKGEVGAQKSFFKYAMYIALFPQLVAGPIVRYKDVVKEIEERKETFELFGQGVKRFIIGLAKKVVVADTIYFLYTNTLNSRMAVLSYVLVAIGFTLQIYYDFSGYSDMAIGLGKMLGFNFKENFNYPLVASSVTDFWRKWHMSLSSFFRDYIYIPLGGNRCSKLKNIRNILVVWLLTGLWHGASWNFILWGLYFFIFLILEKFVWKNILKKKTGSYIYTFVVVVISFVIFSITDLEEIGIFLKGLCGFGVPFFNKEILYILKNNWVIILVAFLGMGPWFKNFFNTLEKGKFGKAIESVEVLGYLVIFMIVIANIVSVSFNPFIYFRF